jgi:hypothetical protein
MTNAAESPSMPVFGKQQSLGKSQFFGQIFQDMKDETARTASAPAEEGYSSSEEQCAAAMPSYRLRNLYYEHAR